MPKTTNIRHRQLESSTKVPIKLSPYGLLYIETTIDTALHSLVLDTSFPGVVYSCKSEGTSCPKQCTTSSINFKYPDGGFTCVDKVTASLKLGGSLSVASLPVGRIPSLQSFFGSFSDSSESVDGVLGVGLPEFPDGDIQDLEKAEANLASTWTSYSIYVAPVGEEKNAFLSVGDVDSTLISSQGLIGHKFTAVQNEGYTLSMTDFIVDGASAKSVSCDGEAGCAVVLNSASPIITVSETTWKELEKYIDSHTRFCHPRSFGDEFVTVCKTSDGLPDIGFTIGDQTFFLTKEQYTMPVEGKDDQVAVLITYDRDNKNGYALGAPFFRAFYTAFDTVSRTVTLHCKDGVTCKKDYKPLAEPAHDTLQPSPTAADSDSNTPTPTAESDLFPPFVPSYSSKPGSPSYYTARYDTIEVDTTADEVVFAHVIGVIIGIAGAVIILVLAVFGQCRKRRRNQPAPAAGAAAFTVENDFDDDLPTLPESDDVQQIVFTEPVAAVASK